MTLAPNESNFLLHRLETGIEGLLGILEDCESNLRTFVHGTTSMFNHISPRELNEQSESQINGRLRRLEKATGIAATLVAARKTIAQILNTNESFTPNTPNDDDYLNLNILANDPLGSAGVSPAPTVPPSFGTPGSSLASSTAHNSSEAETPNTQQSHNSHISHDFQPLPNLPKLAPLSAPPYSGASSSSPLCASVASCEALQSSRPNPQLNLTIPSIRAIPLDPNNPTNPLAPLFAHIAKSQDRLNKLQTLPTPKPRTYQRINDPNDPESATYGPNHPYAQSATHKFEIPESDWNPTPPVTSKITPPQRE